MSKTKRLLKNCAVIITGISKKDKLPRSQFRELNLGTPIYLTPTPIEVYPRVPRYVDVLQTGERGNTLALSQPPALLIKDEFNNPSVFHLTIAVVGDGIDEEIKIEIDWNGKWDGLIGKKFT